MCGIIASIQREQKTNEEQKEFLLEQYDAQSSRGSKGFGLIEANKKGIKVHRSTSELKTVYDIVRSKSNILVFHHRLPTSTENKKDQTHPIHVSHAELKYDWLVIHNGVIRNPDELRKYHENELGYVYTTKHETSNQYSKYLYEKFNDTESFAIELARYLEGLSDEIGTLGSAAFIAIKITKKSHKPIDITWGTNGKNPLVYDEIDGHITIASELEEGTDCVPDVAMVLSVHNINNPKNTTYLDKTKQILLKFKEEVIKPVEVKTATNYLSNAIKPQTQTTSTKKSKFEYPEHVATETEKAMYRMVERRKEEIIEVFHNHYQNLIYATSDEDSQLNEEETLMNIERLLGQMNLSAEKVTEYVEDKEIQSTYDKYYQQTII